MRLRQPISALASILLSAAFAALPAQAAVPAYAPTKLRLCQPCVMPMLPIAMPRQGIVLAYGSILSEGSTWYLVDLEKAEARRVLARFDRGTKEQNVVKVVTRALLPAELSELTQLANRIWASKDALPTQWATDVVWDLWVLDAGDARRDFGPGRPAGLAKEVADRMDALVGPYLPVEPGATQ
jgi:hypothetical protein